MMFSLLGPSLSDKRRRGAAVGVVVSALSQKYLKSQRREDSYLELLRRSRERALALGEIGRTNDSPLLLELGAILLRDDELEAGAARELMVMERRAR